MRSSVRRTLAIALTAGLAGSAFLSAPAASAASGDPLPLGDANLARGSSETDGAPSGRSGRKTQAYLLKLQVRPTAKVFDRAGEGAAGRRAARSQLSSVESAQRSVIADLPAKSQVLYRTHAVLSGVAVTTNPKNVDQLEAIPGVAAVYPIAPKTRSLTESIPLQGGPAAWQSAGTGKDVKIAIIDTGVDYTHADFGGDGTVAAFNKAKTITDDSWATTKVPLGYDFVGDAYNANKPGSVPVPDPNPLDCGGHGTHVAGIAAGQGVTTGGGTYTGVSNESTDFSALDIGPGMAPEATLHAYKVFGCEGSTNIVTEAIDTAVDPNGDGDPSDGADVINMSLGADFGSQYDADSVASNAAVDAGVVVVASAGNGGDVTDVAGSPANATKAISVANSMDGRSVIDGADIDIAGTVDTFGVTRSISYDWAGQPDLSGPVVLAPDTNPTACNELTPAEAAIVNGKVVLVTWTQEALECGSVRRGGFLYAAGATGFIFANSAETFDGGITGVEEIPGVLMVKSGGDAIRAALLKGDAVTVNGTRTNSVVQVYPEDVNKVAPSSSRGIRAAGNLKPDITAVGTSVFSAAVGTGNQGISETGTSMAGPTVAGLAALVQQAHPTWTPLQVKAAMMNTSSDLTTGGNGLGDRYAPVRVGAGRIQAQFAVDNEVLAFVTDDPGAVSVSFGPVEVSGPAEWDKEVSVQNTGASAVTYDVGFDQVTAVEGMFYSVSPASITVEPGATEQVTVRLVAQSREALDNSVDPTVGRTSFVGLPRSTVAEASGLLTLQPLTGNTLRVPVYAASRPVSALTGGSEVVVDPATQKATVTMSGPGVGFGVNGTFDADPANDINSIGGAFELAASSPAAPKCASPSDDFCYTTPNERAADIRRVGVTTDEFMAYFAVEVDQAWNTPAGNTVIEVYLDTDRDGASDYVGYTNRIPDNDVLLVTWEDLTTGDVVDEQYLNGLSGTVDTAIYDSDVVIMPLGFLNLDGVDPANPRIDYGVLGWSYTTATAIDAVGMNPGTAAPELSVELGRPGLKAVDANNQPIYMETGNTVLDVTRDPAVYQANKSQGLMLVHLHNAVGDKSEVLDVKVAPAAAGATTTTLQPGASSVEVNTPVSLPVAVTGTGGTPTGEVRVVAAETGAVLASGALGADGRATLSYTPGTVGTVRMVARYVGDAGNAASSSTESVLTVTAAASPAPTTPTTTPTPTPTPTPTAPVAKKKQRLAASLPRRIKVRGLTLITPANANTTAGQQVRTRVSGRSTAAGQTRLYRVVRGKNGKVSVRTFGHRDLRLVILQTAPATDGYTRFERRAIYVGGQRRR